MELLAERLDEPLATRTAEELRGLVQDLRENKPVDRKTTIAFLRRAAFEMEALRQQAKRSEERADGTDKALREASRRLVRCAEMRQQAEAKCEEFRKEALASRQHPRGLYVKLYAMHYATALQAWGAKVGKGLTAEQATAQAAKLAHSMTVLALHNAC